MMHYNTTSKHCSSGAYFYAIIYHRNETESHIAVLFFSYCHRKENAMKYIDDILYLLGWLCVVVVGFSYAPQIGGISLGAGCFITSWIFARFKSGRHGDNK